MAIANVVRTVVQLSLMILVGFLFAEKKWLRGASDFMSKYLVCISLPCNVMISVWNYVDSESTQLLELLGSSGCTVIVILINALTGWICSCIFRVKRNRKGVLIGAVSFPNTLLMGFPVIEGLLGSTAMGNAVAFYLVDTILFWTLGTYVLLIFGENGKGEQKGKGRIDMRNLKKIFSPSLYALLLALLMVLLGIRVPAVFSETILKISQSSTAISMIFIGSMIRGTDFRRGDCLKDSIVLFIAKFLVLPVVTFVVLLFLPVGGTAKLVIYIITVMPMAVNFSILSHEYKCDSEFAAVVSSLMNILSLVFVPVYITIINYFKLFS